MDSHGSASPTHTGATSRSAGGATVTRRRQTEPPEFRDAEHLPIEKLLALSEQVGRSAMCACGKRIVELGTGAWRADQHPMGDDRIACKASEDKYHHPLDAAAEMPSRTGDLL
ncbi:hypothetical protein ABZ912_05400 [Nonomuraea angiospora]|uniref:hypothetical protein n=1 Tax=Nonomuraea angiospora TaxID=46172 RepID=UPI0034005F5F